MLIFAQYKLIIINNNKPSLTRICISLPSIPVFSTSLHILRDITLRFCFISSVISSTLPVILKCSSPANRFIIDEISIALNNGTHVLMASTSKALQQCGQTQQKVEGRHECQFTINYGNFGIDVVSSVNSVAVKYHCFSD